MCEMIRLAIEGDYIRDKIHHYLKTTRVLKDLRERSIMTCPTHGKLTLRTRVFTSQKLKKV